MGLFNKLFGSKKNEPAPPTPPAAPAPVAVQPPATAHAAPPQEPSRGGSVCSLQILYTIAPEWLPQDIAERTAARHASFVGMEVDRQPAKESTGGGSALDFAANHTVFQLRWGRHRVDLALLEIPIPAPIIATCLQGAFFSEDLKREASHHAAHALLWYTGASTDRLEQMVTLSLLAGALAEPGGLAIVNENGCTATSVAMVRGPEDSEPLEHLQQLPIPMLYVGVKIFDVPHQAGAWARTFGCGLLGLPDLAVQILQHGAGEEHLMLISRVLAELYAAQTDPASGLPGGQPAAGMGMQLNEGLTVRFHTPPSNAYWLESPANPLWVLEIIAKPVPPGDATASAAAATPPSAPPPIEPPPPESPDV